MTFFRNDWSEEEVREDTIDDLLAENDLNDLQRIRREMGDRINATVDDCEAELLEYRLDVLLEAIDRVTEN